MTMISAIYEEKDENMTCIVSEYSKIPQRYYKTRQDWVGKLIYYELCTYLPTPLLGQDMTQGQFLSGV